MMSPSQQAIAPRVEPGSHSEADATGRERPFFVDHANGQLYCVLYECQASSRPAKGVVFCPPYPWEYQGCDRLFVHAARRLAAAGLDVLRFDYSSTRESTGSADLTALDTHLSDVQLATDQLRSLRPVDSVGLLGARAGATLAAMAADRDPSVEFLILWDPIPAGKRYMTRCLRSAVASRSIVGDDGRHTSADLRSQLERGESVELAGFVLSAKLYDDWLGIDALRHIERRDIPCLLLETCAGQSRRDRNVAKLARAYMDANDNGRLAVADEPPYWVGAPPFGVIDSRPALITETLSWLADLA